MTLPQQLEDKKKGCGNRDGLKLVCGKSSFVNKPNLIYLCPKCKAEIAILEQAIAEMQKQRQEILYIFKEAGAKNRMSCLNEDGTRNYFIHFTPKEWGELLLQLNQPKTEQ